MDLDQNHFSLLSDTNIIFSDVSEVYTGNKQDHFYIPIIPKRRNWKAEIKALVNSGASSLFINENFVRDNKVSTKQLKRALSVRNINEIYNKARTIKEYIKLGLLIKDHEENKVAVDALALAWKRLTHNTHLT